MISVTGQHIVDIIIQVISSAALIFAGAGFWAWLTKKSDKKNGTTRLLLGLAHQQIVADGMRFIQRGWITKDEYDDFVKYLYEPYSEFGGNGLAENIMDKVKRLDIRVVPFPETEYTSHT